MGQAWHYLPFLLKQKLSTQKQAYSEFSQRRVIRPA